MSGTDFASSDYWARRFEAETDFEWLVSSDKVIPVVVRAFRDVLKHRDTLDTSSSIPVRILHFGCGTSRLGEHVRQALETEAKGLVVIEVIDSDYVAEAIRTNNSLSPPSGAATNSIVHLDVLAPVPPELGMFDILLDKSTADAISCGPSLLVDHDTVEPLLVLCRNLASVLRSGGRWVCISYSEQRFPNVPRSPTRPAAAGASSSSDPRSDVPWQLLSREMVATAYLPEGRRVKEANGKERVVYEPETGIWAYMLERV